MPKLNFMQKAIYLLRGYPVFAIEKASQRLQDLGVEHVLISLFGEYSPSQNLEWLLNEVAYLKDKGCKVDFGSISTLNLMGVDRDLIRDTCLMCGSTKKAKAKILRQRDNQQYY